MVIINQTIINNLAAKINAKEKQSNKTTTISSSSTDTQYPSAKAVYTALQNANDDLFFKTKNGSTSNYINLFEIRPTGDYQAKPITFEIIRNTKPTPIYVSVRLANVTLASNDYAPQALYAWGTSDTTIYLRKEANNVFNVIVLHTANEEMSICNMNNPNQSVKITPLGTVYGTNAPASSGDNQVWYHTYTVGGTTFGTGTNNVVRGNDSRLSDTRNPKSTKISAGSDLDTYTTTGFYYNNVNSDCATITPLPQPNKAFFLQVEDWGSSNYTKQTITHYDPVKTYERIRNAGTWGDWYELQHNDGTGGENLLRTEPNNEGNSGIAYTIADETFHNDKVYYRNETSQDTTKYSGWTWVIPRNEFDYGDIFTLSFYAKGTSDAEIRTYFAGGSGYISNRRISSNSDVDNNVSSYGDGATRFHLTSGWKRYYVTYQLNSTATTPTQNKSIHIRTFGASTDIEFYISNVKLERGYYATDYNKHTKDNEPLYFPTEVLLPTTTTSANRRKFIHPPYKFKNIPNWTVEGEIKVTGNSARFELHKTDDTNLKNFIALGKNASGNLAYWWGTSSSAESSKTYDASHIAVDTWYPFRISRMGNNVLFMFNNTDKYEVTTTYFNTFEYIEPSIFGYGTNGVSVRNLKITPLEPVHPLSPNNSVCTNAQGIITTESKNNHNHSDTQLNWNGGAMVNSASPLDMCLNEELSPNRLAYLSGDNIDVDYSTDGGSTWTSYGASATEKSKLVTTTQTFVSGKGATASSNNQLRITIHSGLTSDVISQIYVITRKLMIYYSTGGGSGNKVKIQTNTYGSPDTWTDVKEYNIGGYSGWNSFPLNITFGGFANQTNTTRIKSIRLIFTITSNHNFNVQKIRLYGENCYTAQSDYAKTGHIYTVDINKNTTFPAKIIKSDGTSSQFLMANGDVQNKVTSWSNTPSDSNIASEKLVKDSLDEKADKDSIVTSISSSSTDTQYPSAKAVYENIQSNKNVFYGTCSTSADTSTKVVTVSDGWDWNDGNILFVLFTYANDTTGVKLSINEESKTVSINANSTASQYHWKAKNVVCFMYNATSDKMIIVHGGTATTTYYGTTKLSDSVSSTSSSVSATPNAVKQAYDLANSRENPSNKVSSWSQTTNNTRYPTEKLVKDSLDGKEDKTNKVTNISSSSTDTQYPSAKAIYDVLPTSNIPADQDTILTTSFFQDINTYNIYLDEGSRQNSGSPSITYNDGELLFTSENIYGCLNYDYSNIFSQTNYYTISFKIKKPSGSYAGKDFDIDIGDGENAVRFFFGYYNIDCRMINEDEAQCQSGQIVYARDYTDVSITRSGNMWTLDYNNGEYVGTVTSYNNTIVNKLIVRDINWNNSGTIYIKDIVVKPKKQCIADLIYPIGSIYMSVNNVSPQALFGGSWEQIKDRFLLSSGDTYTNGSTGGEATHTLTTNEMPSHTHIQNSHNHTQNGHTHGTTTGRNFIAVGDGDNWGYTSAIKIATGTSGTAYYYPHSDKNTNGITEPSATASTTATNQSATATNQNTGSGQAHNNMPPYLTVYMWKRTA